MLFDRMKAVACRYWGVPPWELDRQIDAGGVSFDEVMELVKMLGHDPMAGPWLFSYLSPETVTRIKEDKKAKDNKVQFARLLPMVQAKNEKERWFLDALKNQLNAEIKNEAVKPDTKERKP